LISLPFFKFYVNDWLNSEKIAFLTLEQVGAYIMLLAKEWTQPTCTLPGDPRLLTALIKWTGSEESFLPVLACFVPTKKPAGRLYNPRLLKEWEAAQLKSQLWRESGRLGAEKRWAEKPAPAPRSNENGRDYQAESKAVLAFLNEKASKHFRETPVNLNFIAGRLKGDPKTPAVDVQTCKSLIARKVRDWKGDEKMDHCLRPETLFNKTKFETYLAEVTP